MTWGVQQTRYQLGSFKQQATNERQFPINLSTPTDVFIPLYSIMYNRPRRSSRTLGPSSPPTRLDPLVAELSQSSGPLALQLSSSPLAFHRGEVSVSISSTLGSVNPTQTRFPGTLSSSCQFTQFLSPGHVFSPSPLTTQDRNKEHCRGSWHARDTAARFCVTKKAGRDSAEWKDNLLSSCTLAETPFRATLNVSPRLALQSETASSDLVAGSRLDK